MYPGTIVRWHDRSQIDTTVPQEVDYAPLFMTVISSDKGPEDFREVSATEFQQLYGSPIFEKHGQVGIQAANICNAGGRLFIKRIVAEDSLLANTVLVAKVEPLQEQRVDGLGNPLYIDADGNTTTENTGNPIYLKKASITWEAKTIENCKSFDEVVEAALLLENKSAGEFPVVITCDNGRGVSNKSFRLTPDYNTSRTMGVMFYTATVYDGNYVGETTTVTIDPDVIYNNTSYRIEKTRFANVNATVNSGVYSDLISYIAEVTEIPEYTVRTLDLVNCVDTKGKAVSYLALNEEGIDPDANFGVDLVSGSNGVFGNKPGNPNSGAAYEAWTAEMVKAYDGSYDSAVFDVDQHKVCAILDANLPIEVKTAIARLVAFRQDCVFFRDLGIGLRSITAIQNAYNDIYTDADIYPEGDLTKLAETRDNNRYIATYCTSYEIKDPFDYRNIEVTMLYDLAYRLVAHFSNNFASPVAGVANSFVMTSAIKGTLNIVPAVLPNVNQKEILDELRINYAIFQGDRCVVQSEYTSQTDYTQLSFLNHVILMQTVIRAIREACPIVRFTLSTTADLENYSQAVNNVLNNFASLFSILRFAYTGNEVSVLQKIYYASIEFGFLGWAQTEIFDVYAVTK